MQEKDGQSPEVLAHTQMQVHTHNEQDSTLHKNDHAAAVIVQYLSDARKYTSVLPQDAQKDCEKKRKVYAGLDSSGQCGTVNPGVAGPRLALAAMASLIKAAVRNSVMLDVTSRSYQPSNRISDCMHPRRQLGHGRGGNNTWQPCSIQECWACMSNKNNNHAMLTRKQATGSKLGRG
eukprot:362493-Pelagomonas_calceolata.AAC.4